MRAIDRYDDNKMCECLRAVKGCLDGLKTDGMLIGKLQKIYNDQIADTGLSLSSEIDFCLDMKNKSNQRNLQFNYILPSIDRLLTEMRGTLDHETMLKMHKWQAYENMVFFDDGDMEIAYSHIKTADDLLQAVVAEMQSRKALKAEMQSRKQETAVAEMEPRKNETEGTTRELLKQLKLKGHPDYKKGLEIIKSIMSACEELSKYKIDERLVMHPENYETYNGFEHLLQEMGLTMHRNHRMYGQLTLHMDEPQNACEIFLNYLKKNGVAIFTWIEVLEPVLKSNEIHLLFLIMDQIYDFFLEFVYVDSIPKKTLKDTSVFDLHEQMLQRSMAAERTVLLYNRYSIQGFLDILDINFDIDATFEKEFWFEGRKLCTVAHDTNDIFSGTEMPGTKSYNIDVTWPDGRTEIWKLSFYTRDGKITELGDFKHQADFHFTQKLRRKNKDHDVEIETTEESKTTDEIEIDICDDKQMCECLQTVVKCIENMNNFALKFVLDFGTTYNLRKRWVSESIQFCLYMKNSAHSRHIEFDKIYLEIDTLLENMKNLLHFIISRVGRSTDTDETAQYITTADELLNAVVGDMESRKKSRAVKGG